MASPGLSELITTTLWNRTGQLRDNVTKNNALLYRLNKKGKMVGVDGGRSILEELEYAENGTFMWYSGYENLNISPSDVMTAAEYQWKQASVGVAISGLEQIQNAGKERVINLLAKRIENAEKTMENSIAVSLYSDGTGAGGKQIGGLDLLVATDPTKGTVGGINAATWAFWRNATLDTATNPIGKLSKDTVQAYFNKMAILTTRGRDRVDMIVTGNTVYTAYLESLQAIQRITTDGSELAGAGFTALKYFGAGQSTDVVLDGGIGGGCPADRAYFLNTDYIYFRPSTKRNFVPLDGDRVIPNQDAIYRLIVWAGNMTVSNRSLQGVIFNSAPTASK